MSLEQSDFQDQLVRGLAHRMNNILTLFHGYVGLMLNNDGLDKTTRDGLGKIKDGAKAASELMDRTQALVRPSTVVWREIDLAEMLRMLKPTIDTFRSPRTKLEMDLGENVPHVWADMSRLRTAILELARNACEATGSGGRVRFHLTGDVPQGDLGLGHASQPIRLVSLEIIDDGPGIAPEIATRIFQPFFSTRRKRNATGLGLNVAQGLIEQLGGILRHESEPGKTRFQILLPCRGQQ